MVNFISHYSSLFSYLFFIFALSLNFPDILKANDTLYEKLNKEIKITLFEDEYFISKDKFKTFPLEKLKTDSKNLFNVYNFTKKNIIELLINVFENNLDEKLLIGNTDSEELIYNINKGIEYLIKTDFLHEGIIFKEVLPFINVIDEETIESIEEQKLYKEKLEDYWKYQGKYDNCEPKEPRYEYKRYITLKDETKELIKWLKKE